MRRPALIGLSPNDNPGWKDLVAAPFREFRGLVRRKGLGLNISICIHGFKMRSAGYIVLLIAAAMAFVSVTFVAIAYHHGWEGQVCAIGPGLCERPSLLFIPTLAAFVWGIMLSANE
jgi:hypothetical protein